MISFETAITEIKKNRLQRLGVWLKAARAPFLTATIVPVLLGAAVAWNKTARFNLFNFLLTLAGVIFIHTGTNTANDYFDHKTGNDWLNKNPTPFSGGSRVIQEGKISPGGVLIFSLSCFIIGSIIGLWINYRLGTNVVLLIGIAGVFCGFFYTASPIKIGYSGLGELIVGMCFGPLVVMGSYYVQALRFAWAPFWASIPVGILIALVLYINEFPDYEADMAAHKRTAVVSLGRQRAVRLYHFLLVMAYVSIVAGVIFKVMPIYTLISLLTAPLLFKTLSVSNKNFDRIHELLPANAATVGLHSLVGILLTLGFVLDRIF